MTNPASSNPWRTARTLAAKTPPNRNRYVDFLRAVSICAVVFGHWLVSLPGIVEGTLRNVEVMVVMPWTQWLSWAMQVMPVFFVVGGYSNSVSWLSAQGKGLMYGDWAARRMQRLVGPLLPLLIFWMIFTLTARQLGVSHEEMRAASITALIPVWFLAVYIVVTALTPLTHRLYRTLGTASFWLFASGAALVDFIAYSFEMPALRWTNYAFVWLAVHQLGFIWRDGGLTGLGRTLPLALGALGMLIVLIVFMGYPVAMISIPGEAFSNSRPPTFALLTLGIFQTGLLLAIEKPARRWLQRAVPWTLTVLVNSRIMTMYLWHLTVMVLLLAVAMQFDGIGLHTLPGSSDWWPVRLAWLGVMFSVLLVFIALLGRFEHPAKRQAVSRLPAWRVVIGTILLGLGLTLLAMDGTSAEDSIGLRLVAVLPALIGAVLLLPGATLTRRQN